MDIDVLEFQKSITRELDVTKNRVRNLIADKNWAEEGRYKEGILRNTIKKFLPSNISIGTGFILKNRRYLYDRPLHQDDVSSQIDIILYDNSCPPLFIEGDFIITTSTNVKAVVEVKSKIDTQKLRESISKGDSIGDISRRKIFNGLFIFEENPSIQHDTLKDILFRGKGHVNHIAMGPDLFLRFWKKKDPKLHYDIRCSKNFYGFYKLKELGFSYFISNLVESCIEEEKCGNRDWFHFPIDGTKERYRFDSLCLGDTL